MDKEKGGSKVTAILWTLLVCAVIFIPLGYYIGNSHNSSTTTTPTAIATVSTAVTATPTPVAAPTVAATASWQSYSNATYSFSLTFPNNSWKSYKVFASKGDSSSTAYVRFAVPTTDTAWNDSNLSKGYASVMTVTVWTKAQWAAYQTAAANGNAIPGASSIGQNSNYVFTMTPAQELPTDLQSVNFALPSIQSFFTAS